MTRLLPRQEQFAQLVARGMSGARAYGLAYDRRRDGTARTNACRLLADIRLQARVSELRTEIAQRAIGSCSSVIDALEAAARRQIAAGQLGSALRTARRVLRAVRLLRQQQSVRSSAAGP